MVICSAGADLVLKKMCYLYVCNYAVTKPELALLTINFLQRDCQVCCLGLFTRTSSLERKTLLTLAGMLALGSLPGGAWLCVPLVRWYGMC